MVLIVSISDLGGSRRIGITSIAIHTANSNRRQFWRVFGTPSTDAAMIFARANFVSVHLSSVTDVSNRSVFTNSRADEEMEVTRLRRAGQSISSKNRTPKCRVCAPLDASPIPLLNGSGDEGRW
jgi:hypothetical protein